jgi:hypothetical protein
MSKAAKLAEALLRDRERKTAPVKSTEETAPCFQCGRPFVYRGPRGDDSGRFCSDQCRIEYDIPGAFTFDPFKVTRWRVVAGGDPGYLVATPMVRVAGRKRADGEIRGGFRIGCRCCGKSFESLGLAYCPASMKLPARQRQHPGRPCAAPGCTGFVPVRRPDGKRTTARARYCPHHSAGRNAGKVGRQRSTPNDAQRANFPQTNQSDGRTLSQPCNFPADVIGGRRRRGRT